MSRFLSLLLLLNVVTINASDFGCPDNWLDCGDEHHTCVARIYQCDGTEDCSNGQDEFGCHDPRMKFRHVYCPNQFQCDMADRCLPLRWKCDGHVDCPHGDDEHNCTKSDAHCEGFLCADMTCIPSKWQCDKFPDCPDGSDESNCNGTNTKDNFECDKDLAFFKCASTGHCIPEEKVCDNKTDCPKGDDEGSHCTVDYCKDAHCNKHCMNTPTGAKCYCDDGYHLETDGKTCVDADECAMMHESEGPKCSHKCRNIHGSYTCACMEGYSLAHDKHTCLANGEEPMLLISDTSRIRGYNIRSRELFTIRNSITQSRGVDIFGKSQRIFWVDYNSTQSVVYSCDRSGQNLQPIISSGLHNPEDLAVDWLAGNIYVTDSGLNAIIVCDKDGDYCKELLKVGKVRAIALDPPKGVMFWTDWGKEPGIYTSSMDGTGHSVFINKDILSPNTLTFDSSIRRLYWSDSKLQRIEYFELDLKHRHVLFEFEKVFHPYSMTVFEDGLFWTDIVSNSLNYCDKFTGKNQTTVIRIHGHYIIDVQVYHPLTQHESSALDNPCTFHRCSHLCLLAPSHRSTCACPDHLVLGKDMETCVPKASEKFLLVGIDGTVKKVYPETMGKDVVTDFSIPSYFVIKDFTYDHQSQMLFFVDKEKRVISSINVTERVPHVKTLVTTSPFSIQSLTYDKHSDTLYWLDNIKGQLKVSSIDGKRISTLMKNLDNPVNLALYPEKGRIFIAVLGLKPHILIAGMDGRNQRVLVSNVGHAVSLFLSKSDDKLYWADAKHGTIESFELGKQTNSVTVRHNLQTPMSVVVNNGTLYWTDIDQGYLHHANLTNIISTSTFIPLPGHHDSSAVKKIQLVSSEKVVNHCLHANCSYLCVLSELGPKCVCPDGHRLETDGRSCEKSTVCHEEELQCANGTGCVAHIFVCDGVKDCPDGSDEIKCAITCQKDEFKCRNNVCIPASFKCDGIPDCTDKSDEDNCKYKGCGTAMFDCGNNECIPPSSRCDKKKDCKNNRDESDCRFCDKDDSWKCRNGSCIPMLWTCDDVNDCSDGSDEEQCDTNCYHRCGNGKCVDKRAVCDSVIDCNDKSDEEACSPVPEKTETSTNPSRHVLRRPQVQQQTCSEHEFQCHDGSCITVEKLCDGFKDCAHDDDELDCDKHCINEFYCGRVNGQVKCVNKQWVCDRTNDCDNNRDEEHCEYFLKEGKNATRKVSRCRSDTCFNGGSCINGKNGWKCACTSQFFGVRCQDRMKFAAREMVHEESSHTWIYILVIFVVLISIGAIFAVLKFRNGSLPACLQRDNLKEVNVSFRKSLFKNFKRDNLLDNEVNDESEMYDDKSCTVVVKDSIINPMFGHMDPRSPTQDIDKLSIKSDSTDSDTSETSPEDTSLIKAPKKFRVK